MIKSLIRFSTFLAILCLLLACAELKDAGGSIGTMAKNVTTDIGHGSRDTVKAIGRGVKRVAKSVTEDPVQPTQPSQ